jgi:hypothetical protein
LNIKPLPHSVIGLCTLQNCTIFLRRQQSSAKVEGGIMARLDLKVAIVQSGRHQYEIARALGVSENALSKFIRGHGTLRPEYVEKLYTILGLKDTAKEPACTSADGASV